LVSFENFLAMASLRITSAHSLFLCAIMALCSIIACRLNHLKVFQLSVLLFYVTSSFLYQFFSTLYSLFYKRQLRFLLESNNAKPMIAKTTLVLPNFRVCVKYEKCLFMVIQESCESS
jgi:hypothetical protein